ncbi:hypothetical protein RB653_003322 (mitochondrion) [Dictyostelium firmibasis]|uniref:RNA-binding S4 domain-containing protein n=1 Tax=Dictyostelium firmibasis TaxID=79012 RepID=A0AAN7YUU3_9MYCE
MRIKKNRTKFIKRYNMDMGELKQYQGYTNTRLNIISNKVFLLKKELYPLKKPRKKQKLQKRKVTTYKRKKLKRILHLLFRIGGKIYRKKIKKKKINLKKQEEPFYQKLMVYRLFRRFYINLKLKQLKTLYKKYKGKEEQIIQQLEKRLDMILLRSGFVRSIYEARQLINHKNILVNGKVASVPGYAIKVGDMISFKEGSQKRGLIKRIKKLLFPGIIRRGQVERKCKRRVRATGPNYLEISYRLLLINLIMEPKLTAIKYPFTLYPDKNIHFISLLKKYKRIR